MKQNFYKITASNRFQAVMVFLRKELGWKGQDPLVRRARNVGGRVGGSADLSCAAAVLLYQCGFLARPG